MEIINLDSNYRDAVVDYVDTEWGSPIVTRGKIINAHDLPGFIAVDNNKLAGAVLYQIANNECEIVVLYSLIENKGVGSKLINTVIEWAKKQGCTRVWLITTNDNTPAIRYYQKRGLMLKAVHVNAFKITQQLKSEFGECNADGEGLIIGIDGIPILHEIEFEFIL